MRKRTTTQQIQNVIRNNLLILKRVEVYHKTSRETEEIPNDKFLECFDFFCESGIFMDAIGWHYERNHKTNNYEIESGRMDGDTDIIVTVYLRVGDGVDVEDIERALSFLEEE